MARDKTYTKESVYEEIRKVGKKGKGLTAKSKIPYLEELLRGNRIQKINSKYYATEIIPPSHEVFTTVEESAEKGAALLPLEVHVAKSLIHEGKIKKVGRKYYLPDFVPLNSTQVAECLLKLGYLGKSGKKYTFIRRLDKKPPPEPPEIPSFVEFVETLQKIYLRKAREYRKGVTILPLIEELAHEMNISRALVEKWVLELPRIFIGIIDLRSFPGESGLVTEDGTEISRIYMERGIVGL